MEAQVHRTISKNSLLEPGQTVLVAVSGGPDSLALLHVLCALQKKMGFFLHVAHIHHGLRPEAEREAVLVKKQAIRLGLPVTVRRVNVRKLQQARGLSLQAAARAARYGAMIDLACRIGATRIATAHHRDDRVETLLMRLLTGSGLEGLKGIPVRRVLAEGIEVIRPLHEVSREQIEEYCREHALAAVHDPSNERPDYLRNRVRLRLLPFLEAEFGLHIRRTLATAVTNLEQDAAFLRKLTIEALIRVTERAGKGEIRLRIPAFQGLPAALQGRVIHRVLWCAGVKRPEKVHVGQVLALANTKSPSAQCSLPDGVTAAREYDTIRIGFVCSLRQHDSEAVTEINVPGATFLDCCGMWLHAEIKQPGDVDVFRLLRSEACLDLDKLSLPLWVRSRREGDRMRPLGAGGSRKVKKILADRKIPLAERGLIPLVFSGRQPVWIGGVEIADAYKVTQHTKAVLYLRLSRNK